MNPLTTARVRPRRSRAKTGCLCCRLRRKKCTEEKPICSSCEKLGLPCKWPQSNAFAWRLGLGIEGDTPAREAIDYLSQITDRLSKTPTIAELSSAPTIRGTSVASTTPTGLSPTASSASPESLIFLSPQPCLSDAATDQVQDLVSATSSPCTLDIHHDGGTSPFSLLSPRISASAPEHLPSKQDQRVELEPCFARICSTWASLDAISQHVLHYYLEYTSERLMSQKPGATNIWKSTVLQLAESDEVVLNAVLAVGSVHLAAAMTDNQVIEQVTTRYVLRSITGQQRALESWVGNNSAAMSDETLRLMLVTCLLAEHECIGGNTNGTLQLHLRASHPIGRVLESCKQSRDQMELVAYLLEQTAYHQFLAGMYFPQPGDRSNNESAELLAMIQEGRFTLLKSYETFGAYFGCAAELYEMIPTLHKFFATRELELSTGRDLGCGREFTRLHHEISSWKPPQTRPGDPPYQHTDMWLTAPGARKPSETRGCARREQDCRALEADVDFAMVASAGVVQNSLLLFLTSAYLRHPDDNRRLMVATKPIVDEALDLADMIRGTTWVNTTWWPMVIVGSYATTAEQRERLLNKYESFSPPMGIVSRGIDLLKKVWEAPDDVFGLDGLSRVVGGCGAYCFG